MKKNIVCIDLDDTLSNTSNTIMNYAIKHDIENLGKQGIVDLNIPSTDYYYFAKRLGWNREELISFFQKYYPTYLKEILPKREAETITKQLKKMNLKIYIITARRETNNNIVYNLTKEWLIKNNISFDHIILDSINKSEIIKRLQAKYFIDDSLDNCLQVKKENPNTNVFLFNTEYNNKIDSKGIQRVDNLFELLEEIRRLEMKKNLIIDGHSHCGLDIFHGETNIEKYIEFAKKSNIDVGLIMGVPSPCTNLKDPNTRYMYWTYDNKKINYHGNPNPFYQTNYDLYNLINNMNSNIKLIFIPTIHPVMDSQYYLEKLIEITDPVALKIHGIGSGVGPDDIPENIIKIIKKHNLPLILHTDRDNGITTDKSMIHVRNINDSKKWAEFLVKNEIIGTLNHGASLNLETFNIANKSDLIKIALGPDKVSCIDNNRLAHNCNQNYKEYLKFLKNYLETNKIIYDADYNWNIINKEDYDSVTRVKEIFTTIEEQNKIFSQNIIEHYPKLIRRIGR